MAALIDAINVKRKTLFEFENTPFYCLEAEVNTPTARGGQTLVRLKMRNLLTNAVFEKTFKASDKFKEPDLQSVPAHLYSDSDGSHFLDQESYETLTLADEMVGNALDFLIEGAFSCASTTAIPSVCSCHYSLSWTLPTPNPGYGATRRVAA
jgi:elongation factor P